jgi:hypothetical protein
MSSRAHLLLLGASLAACGTPVSGSGFVPFDAAADVPKAPVDAGGAVDAPAPLDAPVTPDAPVPSDVPVGDDVLAAQDVVLPPGDGSPGRCARDAECASGQFCDEASGQCLAQRCAPNARQCVSGTRARICDNRGSTAIDADCASNQRCVEGQCLMNACTPNTTRCSDGFTRATCNAEGSMETASRCASGQRCAAGLCVTQVCTPGAARCTDGFTRSMCDAEGAMETATRCASGQRCATGGVCVAQVCSPGATRCVDGVTRAVCDTVGSQETSTRCAAGQRCSGGSCVAQACEPSAATCASATRRRVCDAQGASFVDTECPGGSNGAATCSGGVCAVTCNPGFADCDGNAGNGCETGTLSNVMNCGSCGRLCLSGQSCVNGTCSGGVSTAWDQAWGSTSDDAVRAVAVDASNNVATMSVFTGNVQVAGATVSSAGSLDALVSVFAPDGSLRWQQRIGGTGNDPGNAVVFDAAGNVYACGAVTSPVTLGSTTITPPDTFTQTWVASWSPSGALRWARGFGGTLQDQCLGLAVDDAGSLWAGGNFSGTFTAGTQTVTASATGDVFLMRLTAADGAPQGLRRYGGTAGTFFDGVTARPDGAAVALHYLSPDLDVGLGSVGNAGSNDGLVVRVGLDLATRWQFRASSSSSESLSSIGFDAAGNVYFTGQAASTAVTFGTTGYTFGANDAYAVALSPTGALRWLTRFGSTAPTGSGETARALSVRPDGSVWVVGTTNASTFTAGTLSVSAPSLTAGFLAVLTPAGDVSATRVAALTTGTHRPLAIATSNTRYVIAGDHTTAATFEGRTPARPSIGTDAFVVSLPR